MDQQINDDTNAGKSQQLCDCHLLLLPLLFYRPLLFDGDRQELAVLQITEADVKHTHVTGFRCKQHVSASYTKCPTIETQSNLPACVLL